MWKGPRGIEAGGERCRRRAGAGQAGDGRSVGDVRGARAIGKTREDEQQSHEAGADQVDYGSELTKRFGRCAHPRRRILPLEVVQAWLRNSFLRVSVFTFVVHGTLLLEQIVWGAESIRR